MMESFLEEYKKTLVEINQARDNLPNEAQKVKDQISQEIEAIHKLTAESPDFLRATTYAQDSLKADNKNLMAVDDFIKKDIDQIDADDIRRVIKAWHQYKQAINRYLNMIKDNFVI